MTDDDFEDYLFEWSHAQQAEAWHREHGGCERCPTCTHPEHGVSCSFAGPYKSCECPSSYWDAA